MTSQEPAMRRLRNSVPLFFAALTALAPLARAQTDGPPSTDTPAAEAPPPEAPPPPAPPPPEAAPETPVETPVQTPASKVPPEEPAAQTTTRTTASTTTTTVVRAVQDPNFLQESQVGLTGLYAAGNVSTLAATAGGYYQLKLYGMHAVRTDIMAGILASGLDHDDNPATPLRPLGENINTLGSVKARYDVFLGDHDSFYGAALAGHDSAANLLARLQAEAGYRHLFGDTPKHQLSLEIGAAYKIDNGPFDAVDSNGDGKVDTFDANRFEATGGTAGVRIAAAYTVVPVEGLTVAVKGEALPNVFPFEIEAPFEKSRLNANADNKLGVGGATVASGQVDLSVLLWQNLSVLFSVKGLYDAGAISRRNAASETDVLVSAGLTYKLL
jgi:hypothetical protein